MKKTIVSLSLFAFFLLPAQGAFAWTYDGIGSLNPFTGFRNCNKCEKVEKQKCHKVEKCNSCAQIRIQPRCNECTKAFNTEETCPCQKVRQDVKKGTFCAFFQ